MEIIQFVLVLLLVLIYHNCNFRYSTAYRIVDLPNQRIRDGNLSRFGTVHQHLRSHNCVRLSPSNRRHRMSLDNTSINDSDNTVILVGNNGNNLRITWERSVANNIIQRANDASLVDATRNLGSTIPVPYMVAIAGIPGSGKSSSAEIITRLINEMSSKRGAGGTSKNSDVCVCIPADGYHYSVATLLELQEQKSDTTLIYRRGAPDTFDVAALIQDLERIRYPNNESADADDSLKIQVKLPGFDHAVGDPTIHQHIYDRKQHSILIMEGLYLLYDQNQWDRIKDYFDYTIYIQTHSIDTCMERVKERNVCIPGYTVEEIYQRVDIVDRNNAILIDQASPARAHRTIRSITSAEAPPSSM
jgi:pantothenate kinase